MNAKIEEARLRRVATRQGLEMRKSRRRDPRASDYGRFAFVNVRTGFVDHGDAPLVGIFLFTLDEARKYLEG